jgi:hypothetical protein
MLSSGKGYYEDYLRKQSTERALADPPTLLTDRSAYVNFLEVQLERVSAACMNVASYDQRFNDMQGLIVSLEERCATTTKLVSLAQQCTEEVRSEMDVKFTTLVDNITDENKKVKEALTVVASRVSDTEITLADMSVLPSRIGNAEARISEAEETARATSIEALEERRVTNNRIEDLEAGRLSLAHSIDDLVAANSRQNKEIDENTKRFSTLVSEIESRVDARFESDRAALEKKIEHIEWSTNRDIDGLREKVKSVSEDVRQGKAETMASVTHHATVLRQDFVDLHAKYAESMKASMAKQTASVHKELDDAHDRATELEKRLKKRMQASEDAEAVTHSKLDEHSTGIADAKKKQHALKESFDKIQPILAALAAQQREIVKTTESIDTRTTSLENQAKITTKSMTSLVERVTEQDKKLAMEHTARMQAEESIGKAIKTEQLLREHAIKAEHEQMLSQINKEADMIAKEHKERLEAEHRQKRIDADMRAHIDREAARLADEHRKALEKAHMEQLEVDAKLQVQIDTEAKKIQEEHMERLLQEEHQREIEAHIQRRIDSEAAALAQEHKERMEAEIKQKDIDSKLSDAIREEAERLAQEHRERLEAEMRQNVVSAELHREIEREAEALATEHRQRVEDQLNATSQIDAKMAALIDAEALKLANEHKERMISESKAAIITEEMHDEIEKQSSAIAREYRERREAEEKTTTVVTEKIRADIEADAAAIKKEHMEFLLKEKMKHHVLEAKLDETIDDVKQMHIQRLEDETREKRIDKNMQRQIEAQTTKLMEEHKERLEHEHRTERLNETITTEIEEVSFQLGEEHKQRLLEEHRQSGINAETRQKFEAEAEAIEKEHRERLVAEHIQKDLDAHILTQIEEETEEVRRKHQETLQSQARLHRDTALLNSSMETLGGRVNRTETVQAVQQQQQQAQMPSQYAAYNNAGLGPPLMHMPSVPFMSQQSSIASAPPIPVRQASFPRGEEDDSITRAINAFTATAAANSPQRGFGGGGYYVESPYYPEGGGGAHQPGRSHQTTANPTTRSAYLRKATSHSPPRASRADSSSSSSSSGDSAETSMTRRQRLRAEAVNRSLLSAGDVSLASCGRRQKQAIRSRREQVARDTERAYYAHEQQLSDLRMGIANVEPNPALAAAVASTATGPTAVALNQSFASSISGISDTMITYEGQPSKTRFLRPYFKKDPEGPLLSETSPNRGLYGEGLWLPNHTALGPSVPVGSARQQQLRKVAFTFNDAAAEPKLTRELLAQMQQQHTTAAAAGAGVVESKGEKAASTSTVTRMPLSSAEVANLQPQSVKSLVTSMAGRLTSAAAPVCDETRSNASGTSSSATVEALAMRPHRTYLAPADHIRGSGMWVKKSSNNKKG